MIPLSAPRGLHAVAKADSGTKAEISHGECEGRGASSGCPTSRPGVSCRREAVNLQQPPKPRLHPWDTSVFVPESRVRGYFLREETRFLSKSHDCKLLGAKSVGALRNRGHCTTDKPGKPLPHSHKRAAARLSKNQVEPKAYHATAPLV